MSGLGWVYSNIFLQIKIRKLTKHSVYFGLYCRCLLGNHPKIVQVVCPGTHGKISVPSFFGDLPLKC